MNAYSGRNCETLFVLSFTFLRNYSIVVSNHAGISKTAKTVHKREKCVCGWWVYSVVAVCCVLSWQPHIAAGSGLLIIVIRRSMFCFAIYAISLSFTSFCNTHTHRYTLLKVSGCFIASQTKATTLYYIYLNCT